MSKAQNFLGKNRFHGHLHLFLEREVPNNTYIRASRFSSLLSIVLSTVLACSGANAQTSTDAFNGYILKAVDVIQNNYLDLGYSNHAYTHLINYGPNQQTDLIHPELPPQTMCVAAVAEVIAMAIQLYYEDSHDDSVFKNLPRRNFVSMTATDLRSYLWVDPRLKSYGTADALRIFGMGMNIPFSELKPGSFINLNRDNNSGHAVVFLSFIDKGGNEQPVYNNSVVGFKYFSSQGSSPTPNHGAGFGFRYAFFGNRNNCPNLTNKRTDCGIILSKDQKYLNTGYMFSPSHWDLKSRDINLNKEIGQLYNNAQQKGQKFEGMEAYVDRFDFEGKVSTGDVMKLNPAYSSERTTGDGQ